MGIPSKDGTGNLSSFLTLLHVGQILPVDLRLAQGEGGNIPVARNVVLRFIRQQDPQATTVPVLWWDTDIGIASESLPALAAMIAYGDAHHCAMTANYRMATGHSTLMKGDRTPGAGHHYTDEEIAALPDRAPVGMSGFGLLYIPAMPLDYTFHADTIGEDVHWWWDHRDLPLMVDKNVKVAHHKLVWL